MNLLNTFNLEKQEWFTSSTEPKIKNHTSKKHSDPFSLGQTIKTIALGILAVSQSLRFNTPNSIPSTRIAFPILGLHVWSQAPTAYAQTTFNPPISFLVPQDNDFVVNSYTMGVQNQPGATSLDNGNFVATWTSAGQDGSEGGIFGQLFNKSGGKIGEEFQVNTYYMGAQGNSSPVRLKGGGFAVLWQSPEDGSEYGIFGQVFDSMAKKIGTPFQVNTYTANYQDWPNAAPLKNGGFVAIWESAGQDGDGWGVFGQRFDNAGQRVGKEFQVNTHTINNQSLPKVSPLEEGGFVVTWQSNEQDGSDYGIYGQLFNEAAEKIGNEFPANTYTNGDQGYPCATSLNTGFVIGWHSNEQDSSNYGIYAQKFNSTAGKIKEEFLVNSYTPGYQWVPDAASFKDGDFIFTWSGDGPNGAGVFAQLFTEKAIKKGTQLQINTNTSGLHGASRIAVLDDETVAFIWISKFDNVSDWDVYGRIFKKILPTTFGTTLPTTMKTSTNSPTSKTSTQLSLVNPTTKSSLQTGFATTSLTTREITSINEMVKTFTMTQPISTSEIEAITNSPSSDSSLVIVIAASIAAFICILGVGTTSYFVHRSKAKKNSPSSEPESGNALQASAVLSSQVYDKVYIPRSSEYEAPSAPLDSVKHLYGSAPPLGEGKDSAPAYDQVPPLAKIEYSALPNSNRPPVQYDAFLS